MIHTMVEKYLNETCGPHDGGDASPATSLVVSPSSSPATLPALGVKSSTTGATWNTRNDGVY